MPDTPRKKPIGQSTRKPPVGNSPKTTVRRKSTQLGKKSTAQTTGRRAVSRPASPKKNLLSGGMIWMIAGAIFAAAIIVYLQRQGSSSSVTATQGPRVYPDGSSKHAAKHSSGVGGYGVDEYDEPVADIPLNAVDQKAMDKIDSARDIFRQGSFLSGAARNNKFKEVTEICRKVLHDSSVGDRVKQEAQKLLASANKHMTN